MTCTVIEIVGLK